MAKTKDTAAITTYGDHELIVPENKLRKAIVATAPDGDDPIARAENALNGLSSEFGRWMDSECERLDRARQAVAIDGFAEANKDALFHAAHDIKGQAATYGFPLVAPAAKSLCRLVEHTPESSPIPLALVDQHVDAVRAIYREYARDDIKELASQLTQRLRDVTDDFLIRENQDRPEVLKQIMGPSIAPE